MFSEDDRLHAAGERVFDRGLDYLEYVRGRQLRNAEGHFCTHLVAVGLTVLDSLEESHPIDPERVAIRD